MDQVEISFSGDDWEVTLLNHVGSYKEPAQVWEMEAPTVELAICLAALKSKGVEYE